MLSVFSNCFASHSNLDAVRSGMEVVIRGVVENLTANELEELGWEKHATQTAHFSYDLAARSVSPYPPLDPFMNSRARSAGSLECKGTSLHERYWNTWQWTRWLHDNGVDVSRPKEGIWRYNLFWVDWESRTYPWVCFFLRNFLPVADFPQRLYMAGQLFSWLFVLYSCACAATRKALA